MKNAVYETKFKPISINVDEILSPMPHLHKEIEIVYTIKGKALAHADRFCAEIGEGNLFIGFPNQIHYYSDSQPGEYCVMILSADILFGMKNLFEENLPKKNVFEISPEIKNMLISAVSNFESPYGKTVSVGIINQIMGMLAVRFELKPRIKADNITLQSILSYCNKNFNSDITLDGISEELNLSKYHISHLFNSKLGMGFNTYVNTLRINTACELLEETDKKTADISEETGFGSIRSFNRAFLQIMGMSPLQYRKRLKTKQ